MSRNSIRPNWNLVIVLIAVLCAIGLVIWLIGSGPTRSKPSSPVVEDTNSSKPTISGWDEKSPPTEESPSPDQSMIACPYTAVSRDIDYPNDSRLHGGNLSIEKIPGWDSHMFHLPWISDLQSQ